MPGIIKTATYAAIFHLFGEHTYNRLRRYAFRWKCERGLAMREIGVKTVVDLVHPGDVCLDLGASLGKFSHALSRRVGPEGRVYAIEPTRAGVESLRYLAATCGLTNVSIHPIALGATPGQMRMVMPRSSGRIPVPQRAFLEADRPEESPWELTGAASFSVEVQRLDDFVREQRIDRLDFIKCDVEGAELAVFQGGIDTLRRFRPIIFCEIEDRHTRKYGHRADDVLTFFRDIGYKAHLGIYRRTIAVSAITPEHNDYLLLPV